MWFMNGPYVKLKGVQNTGCLMVECILKMVMIGKKNEINCIVNDTTV